jgi:hypothetical protein
VVLRLLAEALGGRPEVVGAFGEGELGPEQGVEEGGTDPAPFQEGAFEGGVVGEEGGGAAEPPELGEGLLEGGRVAQHGVVDAGQAYDERRQAPTRVDQRRERRHHGAVAKACRADLDDPVAHGVAARRLEVDRHELPLRVEGREDARCC